MSTGALLSTAGPPTLMAVQSDEALARLTASGSDAAFEILVARHRSALLRDCARIVGEADAEEATQDALLRAHAALRRGGPEILQVRAWLTVIARNAALNILRSRRTRADTVCLELVEPCPGPTEGHPGEGRARLREVVAAVQELPDRQREAIVMHELEGRNLDEIASRMGTSSGAVRQLLHRARTAMRARIGALAGLQPVWGWLGDPTAGTLAGLGARVGGCAGVAKLCALVLAPATIVGIGVSSSGGGASAAAPRPHRAGHVGPHLTRATAAGVPVALTATAGGVSHSASIVSAGARAPTGGLGGGSRRGAVTPGRTDGAGADRPTPSPAPVLST